MSVNPCLHDDRMDLNCHGRAFPISEYVKDLSDEEDLDMELANKVSKGFHVRILGKKGQNVDGRGGFGSRQAAADAVSREALPEYFLRVYRAGTFWTFTTNELVYMNEKAKAAANSAQTLAGGYVPLLSSVIIDLGELFWELIREMFAISVL